jgi:hypothetical protein
VKVTREKAIKAINELFDRHFGCDKGSGEDYQEWAEDMKLCEPWDGEGSFTEENYPPGQWDILQAIGVTQDEIIELLGANPAIFEATP